MNIAEIDQQLTALASEETSLKKRVAGYLETMTEAIDEKAAISLGMAELRLRVIPTARQRLTAQRIEAEEAQRLAELQTAQDELRRKQREADKKRTQEIKARDAYLKLVAERKASDEKVTQVADKLERLGGDPLTHPHEPGYTLENALLAMLAYGVQHASPPDVAKFDERAIPDDCLPMMTVNIPGRGQERRPIEGDNKKRIIALLKEYVALIPIVAYEQKTAAALSSHLERIEQAIRNSEPTKARQVRVFEHLYKFDNPGPAIEKAREVWLRAD